MIKALRFNTRVYSKDVNEMYTRAIVGTLSKSTVDGSIKQEVPEEPLNFDRAVKEHSNYIEKLKNLLHGEILQIPPNESCPDQVFVEDAAVVYDGKALLTKMRMQSRRNETRHIKEALEYLNFEILEMKNPKATLDGGDVLFTGREFFIGLSQRTNKVLQKDVVDAVWPLPW